YMSSPTGGVGAAGRESASAPPAASGKVSLRLTQRNPNVASRANGVRASSAAKEYAGSFHAPPRRYRAPFGVAFMVHSFTFPAVSNVPNGPMPPYSPARATALPLKLLS